MKKTWSMEQRLRAQNQRAKKAGARHDLTLEQWIQTLEYFDYKCAYCDGPYEVIEHYLPIAKAGTTASNCVPACSHCNICKDHMVNNLSFYKNENVLRFIESKGVKIGFHIHKYIAIQEEYVNLYCEGCGSKLTIPGLSIHDAFAYIDEYFTGTGYAYAL